MPPEPQDEEGVGSAYDDLVEESDVPRVGDDGVEGVAVAGQQLSGGEKTKSSSSHSSSSSKEAK